MASNQKMVKDITAMDEDFAKWYTDIVKKAELIEYTSVKGCMVIRPYGYAIWENMQRILDVCLRLPVTKMFVCLCLYPKAYFKRKKTTLKALPPRLLGLLTVVVKS